MDNLQTLAELKYLRKMLDEEIERVQATVNVAELERYTEFSFGKFQVMQNNAWSFNNEIVQSVIDPVLFNSIAKVTKTGLSAVCSKSQWEEIEKLGGITVQPSHPFLKLLHVQYPPAKAAVKTGKKYKTIFRI